jgi:hypothetical protein
MSAVQGGHVLEFGLACDLSVQGWMFSATASNGWKVHLNADGVTVPDVGQVAFCKDGILVPHYAVWLGLDAPDAVVDPEWVQVQIAVADPTGADRSDGARLVYHVGPAGELTWVPFNDYMKLKNIGEAGQLRLASEGSAAVADESTVNLPPWESPYVPDAKKEELKVKYGSAEDGTETATQALTLSPAADGQHADEEAAGCSAASTRPPPVPVVLFLAGGLVVLLLVRRVRVRRGGYATSGSRSGKLGAAALAVFCVTAISAANAETRYVYGYVSYWDTRSDKSDAIGQGCRVCTCDTGNTTCGPWQAGCCFRGIPKVKLGLLKSGESQYRDIQYSDEYGFYILTDANWSAGTYHIIAIFERSGAPFSTSIVPAPPSTTPFEATVVSFQFSGQWHCIPHAPVNQAGDEVSMAGDLATYWTTTTEAAYALEDEGDTRLRKNYGSQNQFDPILMRYYDFDGPNGSSCSESYMKVKPSFSRRPNVAHELGHQYHGRVVGCDGGGAEIPTFEWDPHRPKAAEGNALSEAVAQLTALLTWWEPDVGKTEDIYPDYADCNPETDGYPCCNRASVDRNNYLGLWEFIDTSTTNTYSGYADQYDVTMKQLMDGLLYFRDNNAPTCATDADCWSGEVCLDWEMLGVVTRRCHGRNRTAQERWKQPSGSNCTTPYDSDQCPAGQVCSPTGSCYSGDVHGSNVRDWVYNLAQFLGTSDTAAQGTLNSSLCLRRYDNTHPFDWGYHND